MESTCSHFEGFTYKRHRPETTLLYKVLAENLETWLALRQAETDSKPLPPFVEKELRSFLSCGILEAGFTLLSCDKCDLVIPVAFSCKKRGCCPSCAAKRMTETTIHLIDNVLPEVPYRQWVVTFPHSLRFWMSTSRVLTGAVHKLVVKKITGYYEKLARERGIKGAQAGGVTFVQRFGSALNLNIHYHIITTDGVFSDVSGSPQFFQLHGPSNDDVANIVEAVAEAVIDLLRQRHFLAETSEPVDRPDYIDDIFSECDQLTQAIAASHKMRIAFGERAGEKVRRIGYGFGYDEEIGLVKGKQLASANGFTIHAGRYIGAQERKKLEALISYAARPAFSSERLSLKDPANPTGDLVYKLKSPWSDGTVQAIDTSVQGTSWKGYHHESHSSHVWAGSGDSKTH